MSFSGASALEKRAQKVRARVIVRVWEYRQRNYAMGVWFRLRRLLANASAAFAISEERASRLIADGITPVALGGKLHPERMIFFVTRDWAEQLGPLREVALHMGPILREKHLVLIAMDDP
ncbi:MAG TPA: hypothetical protein VF881_08990 [Polyangiaceae bacterium]